MSNKPFPQTPVLTDEEIAQLFNVADVGLVMKTDRDIATAQRDASDRNRDKQWIEWLTENNEAVHPEKALIITRGSGNLEALQKLAERIE